MKSRILIVDDSTDTLELLQRQLSSSEYNVFQANAVADAIDILQTNVVDLLITDLQMPGLDGMHLVKFSSEHYPEIPVLVITGYPTIEGAVDAVKSGAIEYLVKPFTKEELLQAVENTLSHQKAHDELNTSQSTDSQKPTWFHGLIGKSSSWQELIEIIKRINNHKVTVLIGGESGTGKELVARAIHYSGTYTHQPFIPVNCGGIPETLLESELFGYRKGAFTGAGETRAGLFQAADGGTIFLDEIGNASEAVQQRLLRVIQEKEFTMIGSHKPQKVDVRIIAASNTDLKSLVTSGSFREDLYYRLNVISINIPPLRDRKEDIPLLANHFIQKFTKELKKSPVELSPKVADILMRYNWPGNIRELENVIQRALILSDNMIDVNHLPEHLKIQLPNSNEALSFQTLQEMERQYIQKVLRSVDQNKSKAARILGIDRKTLRQKLQ